MTAKNILQVFKTTVLSRGKKPCFRFRVKGEWHFLNWEEVNTLVLRLAGGLSKLGVVAGDRVCIFSQSRYEWSVADLAILSCGAVSVPIYESSTAEAAEYILDHSGAKVVFVDHLSQLKKIKTCRERLSSLEKIILFDSSGKNKESDLLTLDEVMALDDGLGEDIFNENASRSDEETLMSFVYTSGTTGPPKGVVLTHGNFLSQIKALEPIFEEMDPDQVSFLFLPLAHIFARVVQYIQIKRGFLQAYAESIDKILDNIVDIQPHFMPSVPRIFEKVHARVLQEVESKSPLEKKIFNWAVEVGKVRAATLRAGRFMSPWLALKWFFARNVGFKKLRAKLGGRLQYFISGGAPLAREIGEFFEAAGFTLLEAYGLTETSGAVTANYPSSRKVGAVGKPLLGVDIKIAPDGEILTKGGVIFKGYYKKPDETAEVLESDGWFHTGDIGVFDTDGFLKITDRKKDIIVTAGGKNIAPQNIENFIKTDPFISQVMVHGDKRKFLSALITLDRLEVEKYAKEKNIKFSGYEELVNHDQIQHLIKMRIDEKNKQLAKYETIKKFAILPVDFSIETGELTPTLKVKRKYTSEKYKKILDEFYQE